MQQAIQKISQPDTHIHSFWARRKLARELARHREFAALTARAALASTILALPGAALTGPFNAAMDSLSQNASINALGGVLSTLVSDHTMLVVLAFAFSICGGIVLTVVFALSVYSLLKSYIDLKPISVRVAIKQWFGRLELRWDLSIEFVAREKMWLGAIVLSTLLTFVSPFFLLAALIIGVLRALIISNKYYFFLIEPIFGGRHHTHENHKTLSQHLDAITAHHSDSVFFTELIKIICAYLFPFALAFVLKAAGLPLAFDLALSGALTIGLVIRFQKKFVNTPFLQKFKRSAALVVVMIPIRGVGLLATNLLLNPLSGMIGTGFGSYFLSNIAALIGTFVSMFLTCVGCVFSYLVWIRLGQPVEKIPE